MSSTSTSLTDFNIAGDRLIALFELVAQEGREFGFARGALDLPLVT
jgi:hypothetical protein